MIENKNRIGSFTSSEIYKLMKNDRTGKGIGAPGLTYINEKRIELRLGRSVSTEAYSQAMAWGTLVQNYVFDKLPFGYDLMANETFSHPTFSNWAGSPDLVEQGVKIGDIKCYYPKAFAELADILIEGSVDRFREESPEEYWQLVSNAIIMDVPKAEMVLFMPYESELVDIRNYAANYDGEDLWKYRFIVESPNNCLPYIPDGGYYKNLYQFEFEVPQHDKAALTARVLEAKNLLLKK